MTEKSRVKLTPFQSLFYYEWLKNPLRNDYNMVMDSFVNGDLCVKKCEAAFLKLVNEHFVFFHNPRVYEGTFYWKLRNKAKKVIDYFPAKLTEDEIYNYISKPFNLEKDLQLRLGIVKLEKSKYRILLVISHLVIDGITTNQIYEKWAAIYNGIGYTTFSFEKQMEMHNQLNEYFDSILTKNKEEIHGFWKKHLENLTGIDLNFLKNNLSSQKSPKRLVSEIVFTYDETIYNQLNSLKHLYKITPYVFGQLVLAILLHKVSGADNIPISYPIAILEGSDFIYGAHVNTMIVDYRFHEKTTLEETIQNVLQFFKDLKTSKAKYLPTSQIVQYAENSNILDIGFAQTFLRDFEPNLDGITFEEINHEYQIDLVNQLLFEQELYNKNINYRVKYDKDLLDENLVKNFIQLYQKLFLEILNDLISEHKEREISTYKLLNEKEPEYFKIVNEWNQTYVHKNTAPTIHEIFEKKVKQNPLNKALIYQDVEYTYSELNERANKYAKYLKEKYEIRKGDIIVLVLDRNEHIITTILSMLKLGAIYVPLDPLLPDSRLEYVVKDTHSKLIITNQNYFERISKIISKVEIIDEEELWGKILIHYSSDNLANLTNPKDIAYIIYTSGTTGNPKGVMVMHKNVTNLVFNADYVSIDNTDRILSLSNYQFDGSVYDFFTALLHGIPLVLADKEDLINSALLNQKLITYNITNFFITTALFNTLVDEDLSGFRDLKYILIGGEAASVVHVSKFVKKYQNVTLINAYGPTETTTFSTCFPINPQRISNIIPIGKPIPNVANYILDKEKKPVPVGVIGELYIGGDGVSKGYLNNLPLTSERFVINPFQTQKEKELNYNSTIYKTGDLVRYLPDGNIEYIGRNDFQVKIRGLRIELGEIESAFNSIEGIKNSIALVKDNGEGTKYIVCYYASSHEMDENLLRYDLGAKLPDYMIPAVIVPVQDFALTVNGKIDRNQLQEPTSIIKQSYEAPENDVENKILGIFSSVLNIDSSNIGVNDEFYKLGGNSIQIIKLSAQINNTFQIKIPVSELFNQLTIKKLANYLYKYKGYKDINIQKYHFKNVEDQCLSFAQQRLWFIDYFEEGTYAYNIPLLFKLKEQVNIDLLKQSITKIIDRHEVLRSLIKTDQWGNGYQYVKDLKDQPLIINTSNFKSKEELDKLMSKDVWHIFKLEEEYPIKVHIFQNERDLYLSVVVHHIAFDGWSTDIFIKELIYNYEYLKLIKSENPIHAEKYLLPDLKVQYKDYAIFQRNYLKQELYNKQYAFWENQLQGYERLNLSTDHKRPLKMDYKGEDIEFHLDEYTSKRLVSLAKEMNISLYNLLLSGYYLLLSAYSNQDDILIGSPVAGRNHSQIVDNIGFFVNLLVLRQIINDQQTLYNFILEVSRNSTEAQNNQDLPFDHLVDAFGGEKDRSRNPMVQVVFGVQTFAKDVEDKEKNILEFYQGSFSRNFNIAKFDIMTMLDDSGESIKGVFNYATSLFNKTTIQNYISTYITILKQFADLGLQEIKNKKIENIKYLNKTQFDKIIYTFNHTKQIYDSNKTLVQLFEEQVLKNPDKVAVIFENKSFTYTEINKKANQFANFLISKYRIKIGDRISMYLNKSEKQIYTILGILKTGSAYIPMEPVMAEERLSYIIDNTKAKLVITEKAYKSDLEKLINNPAQSILAIDDLSYEHEIKIGNPVQNLDLNISSEEIAYIIYTSGTTGSPKGVKIKHKNTNNFVSNAKLLSMNEKDIVLSLSSYQFDASIYDYFLTLLSGATVVLTSKEIFLNLEKLDELIAKHTITNVFVTTSLFNVLVDEGIKNLDSVKCIVFGGESASYTHISRMQKSFPKIKLINGYGPTETTTFATINTIDTLLEENITTVYIGKPLNNYTTYILNKNLKPLPLGSIGELYIGGDGVSDGYLNNLNLTKEKFLNNPYQTEEEKKENYNQLIYKTGDLVKYLQDGEIEYIGRNDFQVKIRGYRIELGEIETTICKYPEIKKATVVVNQTSSETKSLVAYYEADKEVKEDELKDFLSKSLPDYMIPNHFIHLSAFPTNANGKLDRKALPEITKINQTTCIKPHTDNERKLIKIYSEILNLNSTEISTEDDFFSLGGSSILAIKVMNAIKKECNVSIDVASIFTNRTIKKLAQKINEGQNTFTQVKKITVDHSEDQLLSFAQERLWFIESYAGGSDAYNIPLILKFKNEVNYKIVEKAFIRLLYRHEVLRTLIKTTHEGIAYQQVIKDLPQPFIIKKATVDSKMELHKLIQTDIHKKFKLEKEFPFTVGLYTLDNELYLSLVVHHITSDGWSLDVFMRDLMNNYLFEEKNQNSLELKNDKPMTNQENLLQYKDYALWQRQFLQGDELKKQLDYWKKHLENYETLNLPTDRIRPSLIDYKGAYVNFSLEAELSNSLRLKAKELKVSLYSLLLSGYYLMLSAFSNQEDIVVGTPVAGRHYEGIKDLIGLFVNTLVLRQKINSSQSIACFISEVGENVNNALMHQDLPFEKLVDELKLEKDSSRNPIFQVMFGVQSFAKDQREEYENIFTLYEDLEGLDYSPAKFDLTTMLDDSEEKISGIFNYAVSLFDKDTIQNYIHVYLKILEQIATVSIETKKLNQLSYINDEEKYKIICEWNQTYADFPLEKTMHQKFEEQVTLTPDQCAVKYNNEELSYKELNEKANAFAQFLITTYKIKPDELIPVCMSRSTNLMVALLGILKSGAAYVPIDPKAPQDRISYILNDTKPKLVVTDDGTKIEKIQTTSLDIITLNFEFIHQLKSTYSVLNPEVEITSKHLAYVIYTSGTTGNPKGVMVEHKGVINRMEWMQSYHPILPSDIVLQKTNYTFDVSVWELFGANWYGATLILADSEEYKDNLYLIELIRKEKITMIHFVPSMLASFVETLNNYPDKQSHISTLQTLYCSGEALGLEEVKQFQKLVPQCNIYNLYGPTETTIEVLHYECNSRNLSKVLIGKPIANTSVYVLDKYLRPLPVGAIGELCIGGVNVTRGYLNQEELTKEKFLDNPYHNFQITEHYENKRIYKSGDLVKYHKDGNLEYLGRNDFQVKIRGFRIELGEIEASMLTHPQISQAVVVAKEHDSGEKYLAGYYISDMPIEQSELSKHLLNNLPDYMVPSIFIHMLEFPLSTSGKLDRKQLPSPKFTGDKTYIAPKTEEENKLCALFAEILKIDIKEISVEDSFYRLGGSSIKATQLTHKINNLFGSKIKLIDLLKVPSIRELALLVQDNKLYCPIVELNNNQNKPLFMIHPGVGGCEVYESLATKLNPYYHCYGIDSFNLYNVNKILELSKLAEYYLLSMDEIQESKTSYNLLGWSLGGQIALEIAVQLERRGVKDIKVYLLDTWINFKLKHGLDYAVDRFISRFGKDSMEREKILELMEVDNIIQSQPLSGLLQHTKVILFKALEPIEGLEDDRMVICPYNNIETSVKNFDQLQAVNLETDHFSILDKESEIINNMIS